MVFGNKKWRSVFFTAFFVVIFGGLLYWQFAFAVTRTWDGGGTTNNWSECANWSADTCPGVSDIATFDGTSTKNATIDANISVAGVAINAGYTGVITQSGSNTVTVGSSHFVQSAGTFTGGSGAITINGTFTLSGGTFTSTSGIFQVGRVQYNVGDETMFTYSGGTFNHNNGTVKFVGGDSYTTGRIYSISIGSSITLYNAIVDSAGVNQAPIPMTSGVVVVVNDFTQGNGKLTMGTWQVQGNIIIQGTADGGGAAVIMLGTGSKTYAYSTGGLGANLQINNAALSVSALGGTTDLFVSLFSLSAGTFTAPTGMLQVGRVGYNAGNETMFTYSGGTFNHNNGTVKFVGGDSWTTSYTYTINLFSSLLLYDVIVDAGGVNLGPVALTGSALVAAGSFTQGNGRLIGDTWEVRGNVTIATTADGGSAALSFTGGNNQTYTNQGGNEPDGDITVNKSGGTLTLASNADWNAANQDLTITAGTLASSTYNITTTNFTVNGGTFTGGSGTVTTSGPMLVSSGAFTGGAGNVTINNAFTLSGGTFTSTTGLLVVAGDWTHTAGGTFNHNNGTVQLGKPTTGSLFSQTIDVATTETFSALTISAYQANTPRIIASGDTLVALGAFTHTLGLINTGTIEARGDVTIGSSAGYSGSGGTGKLNFTGSNNQIFTNQGGNEPDGDITVNKSAGTVTLASNADWNAASQNLTITQGLLIATGTSNLATGALTIASAGRLRMAGTGSLTLGGNVSNAGEISARSTTCGQSDYVQIRSSVNGTQRLWSGAGVFTLQDVDVKDQAGTAALTAYSSTNTGNNGANWTFSGAACPALPPAASVGSGTLNISSGIVNFR